MLGRIQTDRVRTETGWLCDLQMQESEVRDDRDNSRRQDLTKYWGGFLDFLLVWNEIQVILSRSQGRVTLLIPESLSQTRAMYPKLAPVPEMCQAANSFLFLIIVLSWSLPPSPF